MVPSDVFFQDCRNENVAKSVEQFIANAEWRAEYDDDDLQKCRTISELTTFAGSFVPSFAFD